MLASVEGQKFAVAGGVRLLGASFTILDCASPQLEQCSFFSITAGAPAEVRVVLHGSAETCPGRVRQHGGVTPPAITMLHAPHPQAHHGHSMCFQELDDSFIWRMPAGPVISYARRPQTIRAIRSRCSIPVHECLRCFRVDDPVLQIEFPIAGG